jgi:hypothetical protein
MLNEAHISYDIIEDSQIANLRDKLKQYKVIILPEITEPDSAAIETLRELVNSGTSLIATNRTLYQHPEALMDLFGVTPENTEFDGSGNYLVPDDYTVFKRLQGQSMLFWKFNLGLYDFSGANETYLSILSKGRPGPPEKIGGHEPTGYHALAIKDHPGAKAAILPINLGKREALASSKVPVLDVATRYSELGDALLPVINPVVGAKYGLEIASFIIENVSVPPEVESAIDKRSSMAAVGNLNDYVKYQMGQGMTMPGGGAGGMAAELAVGFGVAQQMMQQGIMNPNAAPTTPVAGGTAPSAAGLPELLSPADVAKALGVSEADVMTDIEAGELKAKKIGTSHRVTRAALDADLAQ